MVYEMSIDGSQRRVFQKSLILVSRLGLEPRALALKRQNVRKRD